MNPSAEEALWNPGGGESWYMPIVPCKKGFKSVTLYNPEACKVERLLKDKGYWEGGSISSIFTPTLGERSKSIGSGTLSAVNDPSFKNTIRGLDAWSKRLLSLSVVGGTAAEQGPDILNDGKNVVSPFMAGERGDVLLKTLFEPTQDNRRWLEGYLGRPLSPMSGLRNNVPASAQPLGLSAVR